MVSERQLGEGLAYDKISNIIKDRLKILAELLLEEDSPKEAIIMTMTELDFFLEEMKEQSFVKINIPDELINKNHDSERSYDLGPVESNNDTSGS